MWLVLVFFVGINNNAPWHCVYSQVCSKPVCERYSYIMVDCAVRTTVHRTRERRVQQMHSIYRLLRLQVCIKPMNGNGVYSNCTSDVLVEDLVIYLGVGASVGSVPPDRAVNCIRNVTFRRVDLTGTSYVY